MRLVYIQVAGGGLGAQILSCLAISALKMRLYLKMVVIFVMMVGEQYPRALHTLINRYVIDSSDLITLRKVVYYAGY